MGRSFSRIPYGHSACAATLAADSSIHIPIVTYAGASYWLDLQPVPDTPDWTIAAADTVTDTSVFNGCTPSSLSNDFEFLHIPSLMAGNVSYVVDFQYSSGE